MVNKFNVGDIVLLHRNTFFKLVTIKKVIVNKSANLEAVLKFQDLQTYLQAKDKLTLNQFACLKAIERCLTSGELEESKNVYSYLVVCEFSNTEYLVHEHEIYPIDNIQAFKIKHKEINED
jgi:hypothetical protein